MNTKIDTTEHKITLPVGQYLNLVNSYEGKLLRVEEAAIEDRKALSEIIKFLISNAKEGTILDLSDQLETENYIVYIKKGADYTYIKKKS